CYGVTLGDIPPQAADKSTAHKGEQKGKTEGASESFKEQWAVDYISPQAADKNTAHKREQKGKPRGK
ncbi:MAG: hypothetical protein RR253_06980, partial [Oscillospiraceae bacterium]